MNPRLTEIAPSLIRSIHARKRPGDLDLGLGEPTLAPDLDAFAAALEWTRANGSPYSPSAGFPDLRALVARYLSADGWAAGDCGLDQICITVGSEEALFLAVKAVLDPAVDEALIVEPCYLAYAKICMLEGVRHRLVPLDPEDGFTPRADVVLEALRPETRMVILNSPVNPTGRVWPEEELRALAQGLAARPGPPIHVLADEVYRELCYGPAPPVSIARYHPHTLVAGSLSKSSALTGLRLGWLAGPAEEIAGAVKVHQLVNTSASTFSQRVAVALFEGDQLAAQREAYTATRARLLRVAEDHGLDLLPPEGAFYGFLRLPPSLSRDSVAAAEKLIDRHRVVSVPGRAFGESGEGWLRLSWVAPPEAVEESLRRIATFFAEEG